MTLYLIRHGETEGNAARVLQRPSLPLNERGREQAARLGDRLADVGLALIVASDLQRAVATAQAVAARTAAPIVWDPGLHERNYGDLRGTPYADLTEDIFGPTYAPPGGETWAVFHARVDAAWERVRQRADALAGSLAVVTHGLVCQRILAAHLDLPPGQDVAHTPWPNASVTTIDGPGWRRVRQLACVAHLPTVTEGARV